MHLVLIHEKCSKTLGRSIFLGVYSIPPILRVWEKKSILTTSKATNAISLLKKIKGGRKGRSKQLRIVL